MKEIFQLTNQRSHYKEKILCRVPISNHITKLPVQSTNLLSRYKVFLPFTNSLFISMVDIYERAATCHHKCSGNTECNCTVLHIMVLYFINRLIFIVWFLVLSSKFHSPSHCYFTHVHLKDLFQLHTFVLDIPSTHEYLINSLSTPHCLIHSHPIFDCSTLPLFTCLLQVFRSHTCVCFTYPYATLVSLMDSQYTLISFKHSCSRAVPSHIFWLHTCVCDVYCHSTSEILHASPLYTCVTFRYFHSVPVVGSTLYNRF